MSKGLFYVISSLNLEEQELVHELVRSSSISIPSSVFEKGFNIYTGSLPYSDVAAVEGLGSSVRRARKNIQRRRGMNVKSEKSTVML